MGPLRPNRPSDHVASYLARGESVVMEMKQHWARLLPAISSCLLGLFLVVVAGVFAPAWMGQTTNAAWWLWLVLVGHLLWRIIEWHDETFVITNKRLILVHGLFVKKVAMMPLAKVTDMSYNRAPVARLLGYGTFKIESAGQEQALNVIDFVRDPDEKYRDICGLIFGLDEDEDDDGGRRERRSSDRYNDAVYDDRYHPTYDDAAHDEGVYDVDAHEPAGTWPDALTDHAEWDDDRTDPYGYQVVRLPDGFDRHDEPYSDDMRRSSHSTTRTEASDDSAWSVSREHATTPQAVRRSHTSGSQSTWRDAQ